MVLLMTLLMHLPTSSRLSWTERKSRQQLCTYTTQSCLVVQLDQRYNVDEALADPYFDITEGQNGQGCISIDI